VLVGGSGVWVAVGGPGGVTIVGDGGIGVALGGRGVAERVDVAGTCVGEGDKGVSVFVAATLVFVAWIVVGEGVFGT